MLLRLLLLFTVVPLIELALLLWINNLTSLWFTVLLVIATGVLGATLAKWQGLRTWRRIQQELARGEAPSSSLMDGMMILIAGAVLITPGILTDIVGFALLVPRVRADVRRRVGEWLKMRAVMRFQSFQQGGPAGDGPRGGETILDAEFTRHPDERRPVEEDQER